MDEPEEYYFADDIPSTMDYDEPMMYDYGPTTADGVLIFGEKYIVFHALNINK